MYVGIDVHACYFSILRLRQENHKLKANLDCIDNFRLAYIMQFCQKQKLHCVNLKKKCIILFHTVVISRTIHTLQGGPLGTRCPPDYLGDPQTEEGT